MATGNIFQTSIQLSSIVVYVIIQSIKNHDLPWLDYYTRLLFKYKALYFA
ncbi:MAG: hypothetical protein DA408_16410 [Bacteroidetes bacterium]|nr:MAG: hypothetical protein DA408_16410 [Bacteroidota bacterium]